MAFLWLLMLPLAACDLLLVEEVCRHGARAPSEIYPWNQYHWTAKDLLQLTKKGREQHQALGKSLRALYPDLINQGYDWEQVKIISSETRRTIESSLEQLTGLFPELMYDASDLHQPFLYDSDLCYSLDFTVKPNGANTLLQAYRSENCPRMTNIMWRVMRRSNYQEMEQSASVLAHLLQPTDKNLTTLEQVSELASNVKCDLAEGLELPADLTESLQHLVDLEEYQRYTVPFDDEECLKLTCSEFFSSLLADMEAAQSASKPRFVLYAAHEMTVGAFLNCLHLNTQEIPDFASSLLFELHSDQRVVVRYNLKAQRLRDCPEPCRLPVFKQVLNQRIVSDLQQACGAHSVPTVIQAQNATLLPAHDRIGIAEKVASRSKIEM